MKRLRNHLIGIDQGSEVMFSDFADNGPMWVDTGPREARMAIRFGEPFKSMPVVHVSLSMWDTAGSINQRADLRAEDVTETGFDLVFRTWGDSKVARVRGDWMAIGELHDDEDWQLY
jgi:hypothetical protein